jgi:hypothetical protein
MLPHDSNGSLANKLQRTPTVLRDDGMNITITILDIIHCLSLLFKRRRFGDCVVSVFKWNHLSWGQEIELFLSKDTSKNTNTVYVHMHCFKDNIVGSKGLSEQKSSLKHNYCRVHWPQWCDDSNPDGTDIQAAPLHGLYVLFFPTYLVVLFACTLGQFLFFSSKY